MTPTSLTIIGDISVDLIMGPLPHWPQVGTETILPRSQMRAGGSGGNCAQATSGLGQPCTLIAARGDDALGQWLASQLGGSSAARLTIMTGADTTLSVGVTHACGERTFLTTKGHLSECRWADLKCHLPVAAPPDSIALLTGVFLLPRLRADYGRVINELRELGYGIALDTGWPSAGWDVRARGEVRAWLRDCDHLLLNEVEIAALCEEADLEVSLKTLAKEMPANATVIAKLGAHGALGHQGGRTVVQPAQCVEVWDTVGAGDAFNAGYLAARLRGADLKQALQLGCQTAARVISQFPRPAVALGVRA